MAWIFAKTGFYSVVEARDGQLKVRARAAADLDRLREAYLPELSPTEHTPHRDYAFRAYASKDEFAAAMARIGLDISYGNFKQDVLERRGPEREGIYLRVWSVMRELQDNPTNEKLPASASLDDIEDMYLRGLERDREELAKLPDAYLPGEGVTVPCTEPVPPRRKRGK